MKERYEGTKFQKKSLDMIEQCNVILDSYMARGFPMTLRQLYYQLVSKNVIENTPQSYDNLGNLVTKARLAGLIDWEAIEDRTRDFLSRSHWSGVKTMLKSAATWYHEDMWLDQPYLILAVVEKEALAGVFDHIMRKWDIPLLPARGYPSATALHDMGKDRIMGDHRQVVVLHFGDHDPSGIDMSRDLEERLHMFSRGEDVDFRRLALTMEQIEDQNPPPNPAKESDARFKAYHDEYGDQCWELDALSPEYLEELVRNEVESLIDWDQWRETEARIERRRAVLRTMHNDYNPEDGTDQSPETE